MESLILRPDNRTETWWFLFCLTSMAVAFWGTMRALLNLSLTDDRYSHVIFIPVISACLIFWKKELIFRGAQYGFVWGAPSLLLGLIFYWLVTRGGNLTFAVLAMVVCLIGAFSLCFGARAAKAAMFPLLFLFFMIPAPTFLLDDAVSALQQGSAVTSGALFHLLGVPVIRHGLFFSLPGVEIQIAEQCSGIRSSLSLFITGILASYLLLQSAWKRILFSLITIPLAIFKNGVRIVTLSWLGVYVDQGFLHGKLHQYGGLPVSFLALAILAPILFSLRRSEGGAR